MSQKIEYATLEWLWDNGNLRVNLAGIEKKGTGMYAEVVNMLNELGRDGWEVCTCTS